MPPVVQVSIVMPVFNDEQTVAQSLDSCLAQTEIDIEVICVDDASTDGTVDVIERYSARDPRVRIIRQERNRSALQARRAGVNAAVGARVLFIDGDDELLPSAVERSLAAALRHGADLVGFAVEAVGPDGQSFASYQKRLAPKSEQLVGDAVLAGLFPVGKPAQGQLWRFLFSAELLREAYNLIPDDLVLPRINDLPLLYLVAALATKYVSVKEHLYRYHFGRGGSGQAVDTLEQAQFYADAIRSITSIYPAVRSLARTRSHPDSLIANYESVRLSIVGYVASYLLKHTRPHLRDVVFEHLHTCAPAADLVLAAVRFYPEVLPALKLHSTRSELSGREIRTILLTNRALTTGGVSGVLLAQADFLTRAGYKVVIVARRFGSDTTLVPDGVSFIEMRGRGLHERLVEWSEICRAHGVDMVIDHQILYSRDWPEYALVARAAGIVTIGWVHNFVGRPIYDLSGVLGVIQANASLLRNLIVLSPLDVAFWKLRGVSQAAYLPNPPSPMLLESVATSDPKELTQGPFKLIWWGRLEERTKQVSELVELAVELRNLAVDFEFTVVGPDWGEWTRTRFNALARARKVDDRIEAVGEARGQQLIDAIDRADAFVSTSVIEGYPLTLPEAQARGLPVFMYELPWLAVLDGNNGVVSVPQGDAAGLATHIAAIAASPRRYTELSRASVDAARQALSHDFSELYQKLVADELPEEYSPEPAFADSRKLLDLMIFFAEKNTGLRDSMPKEVGKQLRRVGPARLRGAPEGKSLSHRVWRMATPLGRTVLQVFPNLRPLAHRVKRRIILQTWS